MTVAQITSLMLSWLDDEQAGYFNAADTFQWINLAQRQVQQELLLAGENWYMKPVETLTIANQADYLVPSDFIFLHRLEIVLNGTGPQENRQPVTHITTNQQDLLTVAAGTPTNLFMKKDRFTLLPTPMQTWVMRLYYSPQVQDLSLTTDVPDVPEQFMEYLAILACFDGFIKDDRAPDNLLAKRAFYNEMIKNMKEQRAQDISRQVVQVNDYDAGGSWF